MDDEMGYTGEHVAELMTVFTFDKLPKNEKVRYWNTLIELARHSIQRLQNDQTTAPASAWFIGEIIEEYERDIAEAERELALLNVPDTQRAAEADAVARAKEVRIDTLLKFDRSGMAKCLWHDEKTGSLHYRRKSNKAHCFGACGKSWDAIDVCMQLQGIGFREAVKVLSGN